MQFGIVLLGGGSISLRFLERRNAIKTGQCP
jgi:hypothetical protein